MAGGAVQPAIGDTIKIGAGVVDQRDRLLELQSLAFTRNSFGLRDGQAVLSHVGGCAELAPVRFHDVELAAGPAQSQLDIGAGTDLTLFA